MNQDIKIGSVYYGVIKRALDTLQVKAALDGKPDIVVATQDAMDALKAARINELPSEPSRVVAHVKCELTLQELQDLETALKSYAAKVEGLSVKSASWDAVGRRIAALLDRIGTTIKLNPLRKA